MWKLGIILFIVSLIEDFFAILYYKAGQKNFDALCAVLSLFRAILAIFVVTTLIHNANENFILGIFYVVGGGFGTYFSLKLEPWLEKKIIKLAHKGRRKKRWFLFQQSKSR